jgi:predicted transcriptional regulator of viral defense system
MGGQPAKDQQIAGLAARQHGVVSMAQLSKLGFSNREIDRRLNAGRLHHVHRSVYSVGHRLLSAEGRWMAATLATSGVLSHTTAAAAWEMLQTNSGLIHVTIPGAAGRERRTGI